MSGTELFLVVPSENVAREAHAITAGGDGRMLIGDRQKVELLSCYDPTASYMWNF